MLSWVVKVVPQPPEPPPKKVDEQKEEKPAAAPPPTAAPPPVQEKKVTFEDECKPEAPKDDKPAQEAPPSISSPVPGAQPAVLTWISIALPQPAVSPKLSRANSTSKEESATTASKPEDEKGMIAWIAQGLEKVVPQPELKGKDSPPAEAPAEPPAVPPPVVCPAAPAPAAEPQAKVEVTPDQEDKKDQPVPPRIMDWIKHGLEKVVPQPEPHVRSKTEASETTEAPPAKAAEAPAPEPPPAPKPAADTERSSKEAEQQANVVDWIISGIGRMLPQPVQKQDAGSDEVQSRGKGGESPLK